MPKNADQPAHVALLRGINVGGKNKLPMKDLAAMFEEVGCEDVRTYIQSGNVVFRASKQVAERVPERVSAAIKERFGHRVPLVLRTAEELRAVSKENPFLAKAKKDGDTSALHVMFLDEEPPKTRVEGLDPERSPGDTYEVHGREIYLHCPHGLARTKLTNDYFDRALKATSTVRNWNTVLRLLAMTED
jgi:uncharacterized protein (DUF1697 family)